MKWLSCGGTDFFFQCLRREGEDSERGETNFSDGVGVKFTAQTTMQAEERPPECSKRHSKCQQEDWAAVSDSERVVRYRPVSSRNIHHGIFPDVYFNTQSTVAARTVPNGVKERESFCLVFPSNFSASIWLKVGLLTQRAISRQLPAQAQW